MLAASLDDSKSGGLRLICESERGCEWLVLPVDPGQDFPVGCGLQIYNVHDH